MATAFEFTGSAQQAIAAANSFAASLQRIKLAIDDSSKVTTNFNKEGRKTSQVVEEQVSAFQKLETRIRVLKDGSMKLLGQKLVEIGQASRSTVTSTQQLDSAVASLTAQMQRLDPAVTGVTVSNARFDAAGKLVGGTVRALTADMGKLTAAFKANEGAVVASGFRFSERSSKSQAVKVGPSNITSVDQVAGVTSSLLAQLQKLDPTINEVNVKSAKFDALGRLSKGTIEAQSTALGKLTANFTANANGVTASGFAFTKTKDTIKEAVSESSRLVEVGQRLFKSFQYFATYRAFSFISSELEDGVKAANKLQIQMSLIRTISQDQQQSPLKFQQDVRGVSDKSGFDINQVGKAFYDAISNQVARGPDTKEFVKSVADFARTTGSELTDSVNLFSSAINSFGLSSSDAERVAAVFFRTIDEGRIVTQELANTYGRIGVLSKNLGVSMEEVNATLAITTQKGFTTADAVTLLTNALIKLDKPTDSTKAFLRNTFGVDTGEAAVQQVGYINVIKAMVQATKEGRAEAADFFDEIRGRKQFAIFEQSLPEIEKFTASLKDVAATAKTYNAAKEIRGESPADYLNKEVNKLRNIFIVDLGTQILGATADLVKGFKGIREEGVTAFNLVGDAARIGGFALGAYGTLLLTLHTRTIALGIASRVMALGIIESVKAVSKFVAPVAALVAIGAALDYAITRKDSLGNFDSAGLENSLSRIVEFQKKQEELKRQSQVSNSNSFSDQVGKDIVKGYQEVFQIIGQAQKENDKLLSDVKSKGQETAEQLKLAFGSYLDSLKSSISDLKKEIEKANTEFEKSTKSTLKFKDTIDDILFRQRLKYASQENGLFVQLQGNGDPYSQKLALMDQKLKQLEQKAKELFQQGTPEANAEGRRLIDEAARLAAERSEEFNSLKKGLFEQGLRSSPNPGGGQAIYFLDERQLQTDLARLSGVRAQYEEKIRDTQARRIIDGNTEVKQKEDQVKALEAAFKKFNEFEIFDKSGKIKGDFKDPVSGRLKTDDKGNLSAIEAFDKESAGLRKQLGAADFNQRFQLENLIAQRRKLLLEEIRTQERGDIFKTSQERLSTQKDEFEKRLSDNKKLREDAAKGAATDLDKLKEDSQTLRKLGDQTAGSVGLTKRTLASGTYKEISQASEDAIKQYEALIEKTRQGAQDRAKLKPGEEGFSGGLALPYQTDLDQINAQRNIARSRILELAQFATGKEGAVPKTSKDGKDINLLDVDESITRTLDRLRGVDSKVGQSLGTDRITNNLFEDQIKKPLDQLKQSFPDLVNASQAAVAGVQGNVTQIASSLDPLIQKLGEANALFNNLKGNKQNDVEIPDWIKNYKPRTGPGATFTDGSQPPGFASGGFFPGSPRGIDRYPIWAASGEYIVNAESTRMFRPLLESINRNRTAAYMASGGMVGTSNNTTVGDINITVNSAPSPAETAREVGYKLQREIRRGNIRF